MKAVAINQFKDIPVVMDLPKPVVRAGTVLIRVTAAGINPFDWKMADGILDGKMPHQFPMIMGVDGAGVVEEVGEGVKRFKKGDKVYGQFIHAPIGEGSYAEYAVVPESAAITYAPVSASAAEAAAVPTSGMTAQQLLDKLDLSEGETLLVNGATGGVGSFVTLLAAIQGIKVIATVGGAADAQRMKDLGATYTVNYKEAPVTQQVNSQFPQGINGLIDLVSDGAGFNANADLVKPGGGAYTTVFVADDAALAVKGLEGGNFETVSTPDALNKLALLIDHGTLKIPVERKISLDEVPEAIANNRQGKATGKTVILM
ncbi:MAG TPA: NADP-dependent oxidoreductase [Chitinophaga sp.]|uniref:NADP-dependent oxidoreductase n=1 Tax=Chitinophaga sp. TaxID=1869181 RepID=UPI002CA1C111|nr:NADP-dependent oxidoreductase [Chitinophaga sp.]HVI46174.1 NADP-dependent oxidoreductase [Chitinophaga sp.]